MWRHFYRGTIAKAEYVSPLDFFRRFCQMQSSSAKIPTGRLPIPNKGEEKAIFYHGHPRRYRIRFDRCGHDLWEKDMDFVAKFIQSLFQEEVDARLIVPLTTKELNRCQLQSKVDMQLAISNKQIADVASGRKMSTGQRKRGDRNATRDNEHGRRDRSRRS